VILGKYIINFT